MLTTILIVAGIIVYVGYHKNDEYRQDEQNRKNRLSRHLKRSKEKWKN